MAWEDLAALRDLERYADKLALTLTAHLTVTWRSAPGFDGKKGHSWEAHHKKLCAALNRFLTAHKVIPVYIWARERVVGMGAHTHFLVHIPPTRFRKLKRKLEKHLLDTGGFTDPQAVKITGDGCGGRGMIHENQRLGLLRYLAKGINPAEQIFTGAATVPLADFLGIETQEQAPIPCKRIGWTQNIGEAARKRGGYRDINTLLELGDALPGLKPVRLPRETKPAHKPSPSTKRVRKAPGRSLLTTPAEDIIKHLMRLPAKMQPGYLKILSESEIASAMAAFDEIEKDEQRFAELSHWYAHIGRHELERMRRGTFQPRRHVSPPPA